MYRYQLHTHTLPCSRCARMTPEELCHALSDGGYAGAVLTNHFRHGNTGIERSLPWEEFIRPYIEDHAAACEAAKEYGLDILFGIEEGIGGGIEILAYGLTPEMLLRHPELAEGGIEHWSQVLHAEGGLIVQAHPYRERRYISTPGPLPLSLLDGIEAYNHGNLEWENEASAALAAAHPELIPTSGADAHATAEVAYGGIVCPHRIRTEAELAAVLRTRDYEITLE